MPYCFLGSSIKYQGHTGWKIDRFKSSLSKITRPVAAIKSLRFALFFKVIRQISRSHGAKIAEFDPDWAFPDCNSSLNSPMGTKCCTKLEVAWKRCPIVFSCDQAALWMVQSVRPSVCLSVRPSVTPFWLCSHHRIIMKFSGVITSDKSDVHAKGQGQRSKVKVTEVTTPLNRFRTVTPVWIHIWWWNDAYSLIMLRRGALLFFKVIRQISRSHGSKNRRIWPRLGVSGL